MAIDPCCGRPLQFGTKAVAIASFVVQVIAIILFITSIVLVSTRDGNTENSNAPIEQEPDFPTDDPIISKTTTSTTRVPSITTSPTQNVNVTTLATTTLRTTTTTTPDYDTPEGAPKPPEELRSPKEQDASTSSNDADEFISMISDLGTVPIVFLGLVVFSVIITHLILAYFLFKDSQEKIIDGCRNWFMVEGVFTIIAFVRLLFFMIKFGFGSVLLVSIPFHIFDVYSLWVVGAFIQELAEEKGQGTAEGLGLTKFNIRFCAGSSV